MKLISLIGLLLLLNFQLHAQIENKQSKITFLPILYYTPETKLAGGTLVNFNFYQPSDTSFDYPSTIMPLLIYTINKQIMLILKSDWYFNNEEYHFKNEIVYLDYPDLFYGIGNNSKTSDEEKYTQKVLMFETQFYKNIYKQIDLGIRHNFISYDVYKSEPGMQLSHETIPGSKNGYVSGAGLILTSDSRNNRHFPKDGHNVEIAYTHFGKELGSDHLFNKFSINLRKYYNPVSNHVLAVQAITEIESGNPPFQLLTKLGGENILRGYYEGRFRDRKMLVFQTEYRAMVFSRIGFVAFAGIGEVTNDYENFRLDGFKYSCGFGGRLKLNKKESLNLRADLGITESGTGLYLTMNEAF
ncbi:MAG: BamA/TamA family outer membrane protein [Calditrichaceae bacterium]